MKERSTLNAIFGAYAAHLALAQPISCRAIRSNSIDKYLRIAAQYLSMFDPEERDGRKVSAESKSLAPAVKAVIDEVKRWESKPGKQEPFTTDMLDELDRQNGLQPNNPDAKDTALASWFGLGLLLGTRRAEWAQPEGNTNPEKPFLTGPTAKPVPAAFCLGDFRFKDRHGRFLSHEQALSLPRPEVGSVLVTWRYQKNGQNGETKKIVRNDQAPKYCGVTRALDIIARFVRLAGYRHDIPLAVYKTADGHMLAICDRDVEKCMRHLASIVYNLDPEKDSQELQKWSCHSLRIGACVILQMLFQEH